jgi:hypothetical protein
MFLSLSVLLLGLLAYNKTMTLRDYVYNYLDSGPNDVLNIVNGVQLYLCKPENLLTCMNYTSAWITVMLSLRHLIELLDKKDIIKLDFHENYVLESYSKLLEEENKFAKLINTKNKYSAEFLDNFSDIVKRYKDHQITLRVYREFLDEHFQNFNNKELRI